MNIHTQVAELLSNTDAKGTDVQNIVKYMEEEIEKQEEEITKHYDALVNATVIKVLDEIFSAGKMAYEHEGKSFGVGCSEKINDLREQYKGE